MNASVMEGLVGASLNMKMTSVPMRVYHEAERKGDTAKMEQAMGYAADFTERANTYKDMAEEGTKLEMDEKRELEKLEQEKSIEKAREEGKVNQEQIAGETAACLEISEEGRVLLEQSVQEKAVVPETTENSVPDLSV